MNLTLSKPLVLFLVLAALFNSRLRAQSQEVRIYCSLDAEFSESILKDFEKATGIQVLITADVEANKTVGLVNRIISEAKNPRCDVYWNNEVAQTIRLKNKGLLQPYKSPEAAGIPQAFKDAEGYWTGLAARARVFIYNTEKLQAADFPKGLDDLGDPKWSGKITMARPLTGTTMTHVAALFAVHGEQATKQRLQALLANDILWSRGNAMVMRDVAAGRAVWGYTDTDDAHVSKLKGHPTDIIIPDQEEGGLGTLVIPNSVMIVKGAANLDNAKKLVDYILSAKTEARLAAGRSAQIPLRPGVPAPDHVLKLAEIKTMDVDWNQVADMIETQGKYLHDEFEVGAEASGSKVTWLIIVAVAMALGLFIILGRKSAQN